MHKIDELRIERFRGLQNLSLTGLDAINLFVGDNNSGKSSVLEAVALWCSSASKRSWLEVSRYRETWPLAAHTVELTQRLRRIEWLFPHRDSELHSIVMRGRGSFPLERLEATCKEIEGAPGKEVRDNMDPDAQQLGLEIHVRTELPVLDEALASQAGNGRDQRHAVVESEYTHRFWQLTRWWSRQDESISGPRCSAEMVTAFAHRNEYRQLERLSELTRQDNKRPVIEILQRFDPAIRDIEILTDKDGQTPMLTVVHQETEYTPISVLGDGLRRVLYIALLLPSLRGGVLLLDELEVSIHTAMLGAIFDWLGTTCKDLDIQVFAATHSLEAIDAILGKHGERKHDITAYRLSRERVKRIEGELLSRLRLERGLEVRS